MLHFAVEHAFDDLLCCWRAHQGVSHNAAATLTERGVSRQRLDVARRRMQSLRVAVYPDGDELAAIVEKVWCESLETVVHLRWVDRHPMRPGNFRCPCGDLIAIDWDRLDMERSTTPGYS